MGERGGRSWRCLWNEKKIRKALKVSLSVFRLFSDSHHLYIPGHLEFRTYSPVDEREIRSDYQPFILVISHIMPLCLIPPSQLLPAVDRPPQVGALARAGLSARVPAVDAAVGDAPSYYRIRKIEMEQKKDLAIAYR